MWGGGDKTLPDRTWTGETKSGWVSVSETKSGWVIKKKWRNETISEWVRQLVKRERDKKWMGGKKVDRWEIKWMGDNKNGGMRQELKWRDNRWEWEMREKSEQVRQKMEGWDRKRRDQIGLLVTFWGGEKIIHYF